MDNNRVLFTIEAENEQLKATLAETQAELEKLKSKAEKADDTGLGFKQSVSAVKSWIGAVGSAVGVATSMFIVGQKIRDTFDEVFTGGAEKAKKFSDSLLTTDATARLKDYSDKIDVLQSRLAASSESIGRRFLNIFSGNTTDVLLAEIASLEKRRAEAQNQLTAEKAAAEKKAAKEKADADKKADREARDQASERQAEEERANEEARQRRTQQALDDANRIADATLSAEDKIARKRFDTIERARILLTQAQTDLDRFAAESLIKAANLEAAFELKKLEDEREKKRLATEKKAAEEYAKTVEERLRKFYDELNRANQQFGNNLGDRLNGTLEAIRQDMNRIRLAIPQNGGGSGIYGIEGTY